MAHLNLNQTVKTPRKEQYQVFFSPIHIQKTPGNFLKLLVELLTGGYYTSSLSGIFSSCIPCEFPAWSWGELM